MSARAAAIAALAAAAALGAACARATGTRVLHLGDFGSATPQQVEVAAAAAAEHRAAPFELAVSAGDNLYPCGPDPLVAGAEACAFAADGNAVAPDVAAPADPTFGLLEGPLAPLVRDGRPVPIHLALGNHDVASAGGCATALPAAELSRRRACLEVAHRSPQWSMPGRHYAFDRGAARFLVIDSNLLLGDYGGFGIEGEVEFVRSASAGCDRKACFVVAHHPAATAGLHADDATPAYLERLARIEAAVGGRIAAWLAGHDHDLQHLVSAAGYDVLVSGNGCCARPAETFDRVSVPGATLLFASTSPGFGVLEVGADASWSYRFLNDRRQALHCCAAAPGRRCVPLPCAAR